MRTQDKRKWDSDLTLQFCRTVMYSIGEFSRLIGVSTRTLERWDKQSQLIANRTLGRKRYYTEEQLLHYKKIQKEKATEIYIKVSCNSKYEVITQAQVNSLKLFCENNLGMNIELVKFG